MHKTILVGILSATVTSLVIHKIKSKRRNEMANNFKVPKFITGFKEQPKIETEKDIYLDQDEFEDLDLIFEKDDRVNRMKIVERENLTTKVKAMDEEQLRIIADCIPVDICLERINKEFKRNQEFINKIKTSMSGLNVGE